MGLMSLFGCLCSSSKEQATSGNSREVAAAAQATPVEQARSGNRRDGAAIAGDVPELSLRELKEATATFSASRLIGRGAYAEVFMATLRGGRAAAAKRHIVAPPGDKHVPDLGLLRQHVAVASRLRHENVVRLLGYTITADVRVLLYELADVGTLHDALHGPRGTPAPEEPGSGSSGPPPPALRLSWEQRVQIALDAARGLAYLHRAAVAHHDVRPTNVLLFQGMRAKIADLNVFKELAPPEPDNFTKIFPACRGFQYHSPEYKMTGRGSRRSDVFSFGLVLLDLLTGRQPSDRTFPPDQEILMHWAIPLLVEGRIQECIDPNLGDHYPPAGALKLGRIAVQCLEVSPTSRPSMETVARLINSDVVFARGQHAQGLTL